MIYQIYPRSFKDTQGTGVGDLRGIIEKLDHLAGRPDSLGVTAIWISPIYVSPMADFGYDVADYCDVDPIFGNIQDIKDLLTEAHARQIKVLLDFVPNHSSDQHPWFAASKVDLVNEKRDWYIWRDAKADGSPPNNWLSVFGGSAWELSEQTNQYYLHSFLAEQPDLNWENPEVREAMKSAMRFWLDLGVDGFRVDAVDWISKDPALRDDPIDTDAVDKIPGYDHKSLVHLYSRDGPRLFDRLKEMADVLNEYKDRYMITEAHPETDDKIDGYLEYYKSVDFHISAPFNFESIDLLWDSTKFRNFVDTFQAAMEPGYTPIYTLGNHDESRVASRIGTSAARTAAMMLLTLPGIAFVYYGDELGMTDTPVTKKDLRDPFIGRGSGRDPQRTPMQWDTSPNAGFTTGRPWLPIAPDYSMINVAVESQSDASYLNLYKRLIKYRSESSVLRYGSYKPMDLPRSVFGYSRKLDSDTLIVLLNFSDHPQPIIVKDTIGTVQLSTNLDRVETAFDGRVTLAANEGLVIEVAND